MKAALVASGMPEAEVPATLTAMAEVIEAKALKLHQVVGSAAQSDGTKTDDEAAKDAADAHRKASFKL